MQRDTLHAKLKDIYMNNESDQSKGVIFIWSFWYRKIIHIGAIANQLKSQKISSTIVYLPEFIRTLKGR